MISLRLDLAFSLYDPCALAADIGTDHARLPIALLRSGKCRRMILTDLSGSALNRARENIAGAGLTNRVVFRQGDGLLPLKDQPPCGMISILGMGGRTIQGILSAGGSELHGASLLLSAHTDLPLVRRGIMEAGYRMISEDPCLDGGRFYLIMKALPGREEYTGQDLRLGKAVFRSASPDLGPWIRHRIQVLEAKAAGLKRAERPNEALIAELEEDLSFLRGHI